MSLLSDDEIGNILSHVIKLRCQVCPRTSYATTGFTATTLMIAPLSPTPAESRPIESHLKTSLRECKEWDGIDSRRFNEISQEAHGHCLFLYSLVKPPIEVKPKDEKDGLKLFKELTNSIKQIFQEKRSKLVYLLLPEELVVAFLLFESINNGRREVEGESIPMEQDDVQEGDGDDFEKATREFSKCVKELHLANDRYELKDGEGEGKFVLFSFYVNTISAAGGTNEEEEEEFDYDAILGEQVNNVAASPSSSSSQAKQEKIEKRKLAKLRAAVNPPLGFKGHPSVQSRCQFRFLWSMMPITSDLYPKNELAAREIAEAKDRTLFRIANRDLCDNRGRWTEKQWDDKIRKILEAGGDDYHVYDYIRRQCKGTSIKQAIFDTQHTSSVNTKVNSSGGGDEEGGRGRSEYMASCIQKCLPEKIGNIRSLLDYGCAEGAITSILGQLMKVPTEQLFGADVRSIAAEGFNYIPIGTEDTHNGLSPDLGTILPGLEDNKIHLITTSMVFHHVVFIEATILELYRVISKQDGVLIMREHDCNSPAMAVFLDIVHGLYDLAWSAPLAAPDFLNEYKAYYRSKEEWDALMNDYGFQMATPRTKEQSDQYLASDRSVRKGLGYANVIRAYYAVYRPVRDSRKMRCQSMVNQPTSTLSDLKMYETMVKENNDRLLAFFDNDNGINSNGDHPQSKRSRVVDQTTTTSSASAFPSMSFVAPPKARRPGIPLESYRGNPEDVTILESRSQPGRFYRFYRKTGAVEWIS